MRTVSLTELRELRKKVSRYLRRVAQGERLVVTDRDRLIAEGRVSRPTRVGLPEPLELTGDPYALSRALDEVRGER